MNRVYEGIQFATVTITLSAVITLITLFVTPSVWQLMLLITGEVIVINAAYLIFVLVLLGLKNLLIIGKRIKIDLNQINLNSNI